eukprot:UN04594
MYAGTLPLDKTSKTYLTNKDALKLNDNGINAKVVKYSGNCTCATKSQNT